MKALSILSPGAVTIVNEPIPPVGPEEVLCRVARCGICGTDWSILTGRFTGVDGRAVRFPLRPDTNGRVSSSDMGSEALGFREGDR
jgi:threonine dehydrogenase-like Zn-dependent dehydrogenase